MYRFESIAGAERCDRLVWAKWRGYFTSHEEETCEWSFKLQLIQRKHVEARFIPCTFIDQKYVWTVEKSWNIESRYPKFNRKPHWWSMFSEFQKRHGQKNLRLYS